MVPVFSHLVLIILGLPLWLDLEGEDHSVIPNHETTAAPSSDNQWDFNQSATFIGQAEI